MEPEQETPDIGALQSRLAAAETENRLYRLAPNLGVSPAAVPYLARLCALDEGGEEEIRSAVEKVLTDLPGLRASPAPGKTAGFRVGAGAKPAKNGDDLLRAAFGIR